MSAPLVFEPARGPWATFSLFRQPQRSYDSIIDRWRDSYEMGAASPRPNGDVFSMEVTKENFPRMLSALRRAAPGAACVCISGSVLQVASVQHARST